MMRQNAMSVKPISTVQRRLRDHQFYAEVLNTRHAALDVTVGMLAAATGLAAKTLLSLLTCDQPPIRLAAARCILEQSVRLRDAADLERRVMALEERAEIVPTILRAVGVE